jgi:hypothetical protein
MHKFQRKFVQIASDTGICSPAKVKSMSFVLPRYIQDDKPGFAESVEFLYFSRQWLPDVRYKLRMRRAINLKIISGFGKAQFAIDCSAHNIGITVILPIVLPPANRTEAIGIR